MPWILSLNNIRKIHLYDDNFIYHSMKIAVHSYLHAAQCNKDNNSIVLSQEEARCRCALEDMPVDKRGYKYRYIRVQDRDNRS